MRDMPKTMSLTSFSRNLMEVGQMKSKVSAALLLSGLMLTAVPAEAVSFHSQWTRKPQQHAWNFNHVYERYCGRSVLFPDHDLRGRHGFGRGRCPVQATEVERVLETGSDFRAKCGRRRRELYQYLL